MLSRVYKEKGKERNPQGPLFSALCKAFSLMGVQRNWHTLLLRGNWLHFLLFSPSFRLSLSLSRARLHLSLIMEVGQGGVWILPACPFADLWKKKGKEH
ncbi:hypothetical protein EUGRSUZ_K01648 [Eucalyptus grandis]|uniref:Uncharacterized protein n=2 Tax=Eucalyptus grandis TaxID=71139 RepID=A0ACC3IWT9_EUCGR|nr:hypothetical protein EUGRSUZ_K01648 [Eucalyptus grandis]